MLKHTGMPIVAFHSSQCKLDRQKMPEFACFVWVVWKFKLDSFQKNPLIFSNLGPNQQFFNGRALFNFIFLTSKNWKTKMARKCNFIRFFLRIKSFVLLNYWQHFVYRGINWRYSTRKNYLIAKTRLLVTFDGNLFGQTSQKLRIVLLHLDNQTRFPSKQQQMSGVLLSTPQSTIWFFYKNFITHVFLLVLSSKTQWS